MYESRLLFVFITRYAVFLSVGLEVWQSVRPSARRLRHAFGRYDRNTDVPTGITIDLYKTTTTAKLCAVQFDSLNKQMVWKVARP